MSHLFKCTSGESLYRPWTFRLWWQRPKAQLYISNFCQVYLTWFCTSGRSPFSATKAFLTTSRKARPVLVPFPLYGIRSTASSRSALFFTSERICMTCRINAPKRYFQKSSLQVVYVGSGHDRYLPANLRMFVTFLLKEIIPILTVSWPTLKYRASDFKKRRTILKFSRRLNLTHQQRKNKSSLKSLGHPDLVTINNYILIELDIWQHLGYWSVS